MEHGDPSAQPEGKASAETSAAAPHGSGGGSIAIRGLRKEFEGGSVAVDGIDLEIASGEFFSLLGPSGCGKTTTLRMLAGFEQPTNGQILIDGVDVAQTPPHKRPVNTVFQSYALFPHMDVWKNVEYGLRWTKLAKGERGPKVDAALKLVEMTEYAKRRPNQLSGGQQQRVALARALVLEPSVLLLDEPLGALDAKLRHALRAQLTELQRRVGITFVFVTHDQEEALEMSDRLAVMSKGHIIQIGAPREIYQFPRSEFVADFLGVANLLDVQVTTTGGVGPIKLGEFTLDAEIPAGICAGRWARGHQARECAPRRRRANRRQPPPRDGRAGRLPGFDLAGVRPTPEWLAGAVTGDQCRV